MPGLKIKTYQQLIGNSSDRLEETQMEKLLGEWMQDRKEEKSQLAVGHDNGKMTVEY